MINLVDTNIIIHSLDKIDERKRQISNNILDSNPMISSQILSEVINVCLKKLKKEKAEIFEIIEFLLNSCDFKPITSKQLRASINICERYKLQMFDSIIIANAIDNNCDVLYSEDMHHGLVIENKLKIINPYLLK